jgi:hypothetical protein
MRSWIALILAALVVAVVVSSAKGARSFGYWTTATTEDAVFQSSWADEWGIDEVYCEGKGKAVKDASGARTWKHFTCDFWSDFDGHFDQQGRVTVLPGDRFVMYLVEGPYTSGVAITGSAP